VGLDSGGEDDECESDFSEDPLEAEAEIQGDTTLLTFVSKSREIQILVEKVKAAQTRPKHYLGNSDRTKRRWALK
jgi:hypothetical protein